MAPREYDDLASLGYAVLNHIVAGKTFDASGLTPEQRSFVSRVTDDITAAIKQHKRARELDPSAPALLIEFPS